MPDGGVVYLNAANVTVEQGELGSLPAGAYVSLSVQDEGYGIADEHLSQVFDPYFTTKKHGSGLGLASAFSIATKHGGTIKATSAVGAGTTMIVYLPASPGHTVEPQAAAAVKARSTGTRVLLLDDEPAILRAATRGLSRAGYEVTAVEDGRAAVECFARAMAAGQPFDVAILDLTIPGGMGGLQTLKKLRETCPGVRAIVSSGYSEDPVMADYEGYGFVAATPKPYDADALPRAIEEALEREPPE